MLTATPYVMMASWLHGIMTPWHHSIMAWPGIVRYGMVWYRTVWYGVVWCGVVWYGIVSPRRVSHYCTVAVEVTQPPQSTGGCLGVTWGCHCARLCDVCLKHSDSVSLRSCLDAASVARRHSTWPSWPSHMPYIFTYSMGIYVRILWILSNIFILLLLSVNSKGAN